MKTFDAVIVGGGVIGAAIAFELAGEKVRVLVIDRQAPGREASWAAAGMLSPGPDSPEAVPLVPLGQESLRLYPEFVAGIEEASGRIVDFAREGTFEVFAGPDGETARDQIIEEYRDLGLAIEAISVEAARGLEPELGSAASAAAWLPEEATVDPRMLTEAILAAAERRGAVVREACAVESLWCAGGACEGVITAGGDKIEGEHVVIAAGTFCGTIKDWGTDGNLARYAPVRPVRGQMVALRSATVRLKKVLRSSRGYLVPRRDGRIIAGSTLENAGFVKQVTPEGIRKILEAAAELAPALARAEIVEQWAGLRPDSPDHLPIIGPTEMKGLLIATGHYRNGILLAPVTAKIVRDWIVSGKASFMAEGFSPLRFTAAKSRARTGA
ncbi:MAG: glycine oxidase ThiO [Candidatus Acidiferrales bacterium]